MRSLVLCLLALFCLSLVAAPVSACINDREVIQAEKEFKSRYIEQAPPAPTPQYEEPSTPPHLLVFGGGGAVLLAGAFVLGFINVAAKRR